MKKIIYSCIIMVLACLTISNPSVIAQNTKEEAMPFLKGDYVYEYLRESKTTMGGNVVSENQTETTYNTENNVTSVITTTNGQKTLEMLAYVYGNKTLTYQGNTYMNGQLLSSQKFSNTYADNFYRNMLTSDIETEGMGSTTKQHIEYSYDNQNRIVGMKHYQDGKLQKEELNYVWTPNTCEFEEITYFPIQSKAKVSRKYQDENYVQVLEEIRITEMGGVTTETKSEYTYLNTYNGNLTSMKNFQNGVLVMEWKDYVWGDKKNTHTEIMYANGSPISTSEVTQYYK